MEDMKIAKAQICPNHPEFQFCNRNEISKWEDAVLTPERFLQYCESTKGACSNER